MGQRQQWAEQLTQPTSSMVAAPAPCLASSDTVSHSHCLEQSFTLLRALCEPLSNTNLQSNKHAQGQPAKAVPRRAPDGSTEVVALRQVNGFDVLRTVRVGDLAACIHSGAAGSVGAVQCQGHSLSQEHQAAVQCPYVWCELRVMLSGPSPHQGNHRRLSFSLY